ncbi:Beta protein [Burkholderia cepacia]|uniref:beta family protein n=1 Tax=Burkholderia cepacia TaxID=292 RepID=UPI0039A4020A
MNYVAALRVGQNDIKALVNLEAARREQVAPLLSMRGNDERHLDTFASNWGGTPFYLDVSRFPTDANDQYLIQNALNSPNNAYAAKRAFYVATRAKNNALIPVIGWADGDSSRDVVQCALQLAAEFPRVALRVEVARDLARQWPTAQNVLNSVTDPSAVDVIIDFRKLADIPLLTPGGWLDRLVRDIHAYRVARVIIVSTSFPDDKPASGTSRTVACLDLTWQLAFQATLGDLPLIYGDYAATNPTGVMDFIPGMPVIPFANYLVPTEWWQIRQGGDKEFHHYTGIAATIRAIPGYHGDGFCWATREIARIAASGTNYGNNGTWNGFRVNQHICAVLQYLASRGAPPVGAEFDDEDL